MSQSTSQNEITYPMPKARMSRLATRRAPNPRGKVYPASPPAPVQSAKRILAIDPGYTTGMALSLPTGLYTFVANSWQEVLAPIEKVEQVVIEEFSTAGRISAPGLFTVELVGRVLGYCYAKGIPCELAVPQQRNSFMTEAKAQLGKLIERSDWARHEVDALAHLWAYEYRQGLRK